MNMMFWDCHRGKKLAQVSKRAIEALGERDIYFTFTPLFPNTSTRLILKKSKTDSSIRKVWLSKTLAYILQEWKASQDELKSFLGDECQNLHLMGFCPTGDPVRAASFSSEKPGFSH
jgi:hypothetical protein